MRKRGLVAVTTAAAAMVVLAGGLMASNMGFKLNYAMKGSGGGSLSGAQMLAVPFNPQVGMVNASDLFKDITLAGPVAFVNKFLPANNSYQQYTFASPDFALQPGVGYQIIAGGDFSYIVVGSHDPSAVLALKASGAGSLSGANLYAVPYHTTAATAADLFQEIPGVAFVNKFLPANNSFQQYTFASPDYPLAPGTAYQVVMGADLLNYQPSHY